MTTRFDTVRAELRAEPKTWLVTGVAGFIGSNLLEALLRLDQTVVGFDNYATGSRANLADVREQVGETAWARFRMIEGDIADLDACREGCAGVDYVLQQAALGSVPRSLKDPIASNRANVDGFLNMLVAAKDAGVKGFVFAGSSSTYGDHPALPKVEHAIGAPLSPYAVTKYINELYASVFARSYGFRTVGLRYFNVFGRRQTPDGAYAAVIPKWIGQLLKGEAIIINGDGETSRDFCYIENVVQANILGAVATDEAATDQVYNVAYGERTTLNELHAMLREGLALREPGREWPVAQYEDFRAGDVRHSLADISKARTLFGYAPTHSIREGMAEALDWYVAKVRV